MRSKEQMGLSLTSPSPTDRSQSVPSPTDKSQIGPNRDMVDPDSSYLLTWFSLAPVIRTVP
jgi:hypothetical protein